MVAPQDSFEVACDRSAPGDAREELAALIHDWLPPAARYDACLLVSELVANVVMHASGRSEAPITVSAAKVCDVVLVKVFQDGPLPRIATRARNSGRESGRGLQIVDTLAERWGVAREARPCVWFEVAA